MSLRLRSGPWPLMLLVGLPLLYWAWLAPRGLQVELTAKTWRHAIEIERFGPNPASGDQTYPSPRAICATEFRTSWPCVLSPQPSIHALMASRSAA